ncbi:MAG TPA: LysE family transporter [Nitrososphaeraceae archaeon]|nr:LysE family transporter [Nitrososphaeraceae archaeon]
MNLLEFAGEVIVLSASGVLSPGPLFLANLIYGSKQGYHAGIKIANGHMTVELLLIILLSLGMFGLYHFTLATRALRMIGLIGGIAIILFSVLQILSSAKKFRVTTHINKDSKDKNPGIGYETSYSFLLDKINRRIDRRPVIIGVIFTAMNPFFLMWWLTVGLKLISDSVYLFGVIQGILILFSFHIWMDYVWLAATAYSISKGQSVLKMRFYYFFIICISITLILYGLYLVMQNAT